jgi:predicted Zn-dependent protease
MALDCPAVRELDGELQVAALSLLNDVSGAETDVERETIAVLALTRLDLFVENSLFVFGHASLKHRACVCSINRLGEEASKEELLRRTLVTLVHEAGTKRRRKSWCS